MLCRPEKTGKSLQQICKFSHHFPKKMVVFMLYFSSLVSENHNRCIHHLLFTQKLSLYSASFIKIPYYEAWHFIIWDSYKGCTVASTVCQLLEDKWCRYWYVVEIYPSKIDTLYDTISIAVLIWVTKISF